ncbi:MULTISPECIES: DCC1-like thiol-disulfide oxidoreductase family protein [Halorussus]|uniref:DCC1-like thiol-disulfide oxidoreductase family protein n=1 Tax=Halorussus TaxID=1070314 RepID=UPI0020A1DABB|nr:DCC1-like thiol-disulfide oxidoreductase family protein [Halorussus vallis]USZ76945.1 DUF393 domain-containing protein [Halorussus vallis]
MNDATLVYDDDCGFCAWWADYVAADAGVEVVGFAELTPDLRDHLPDDYEECSHLLVDGERYSCGASIEEALTRTSLGADLRPAVEFLRNFEDYERLRESAYRWVAENRGLLGQFLSKELSAGTESDRG